MKTFLKSYLYERYIVKRINDSLSSKDCIEYGVPQGSVLGPFFKYYLLMICQLF